VILVEVAVEVVEVEVVTVESLVVDITLRSTNLVVDFLAPHVGLEVGTINTVS
jgi:hypothetical protein